MALRYIVKAKIGEYTKDGETKAKYADIGVIMDGKNGFVMKLDTIPVGGWDGFCFLSEPQPRQGQGGNRGGGQRRPPPPDPDEDIPF